MKILMDMGTSNTRMWLYDGDVFIAARKEGIGASLTKLEGRESLLSRVRNCMDALLCEAGAEWSDVEGVITSGMSGSELGLADVPHLPIPIDKKIMTDNLQAHYIREICDAPFVFVRGIKKLAEDGSLEDITRGEETEIMGIIDSHQTCADAVFVLPGTHNKIISVKNGEIVDFYTTCSGEALNGIINHSIVAGEVGHSFEFVEEEILRGAAFSMEKGLNAAVFHIRVMAKNGLDINKKSSFLYGAVLGQDACLIERICGDKTVYIGGRSNLRRAYLTLLRNIGATELMESISENAVRNGLLSISAKYKY